MDVLRHAETLHLVMSAPVNQAIDWQVIDMPVMVSSCNVFVTLVVIQVTQKYICIYTDNSMFKY